jgi:CheY-like chemotaxis protein
MRLPWRGSRQPPASSVIEPPEDQEAKPSVLVCDDNASVTQLLEMMLSLEGWSVEVTTSGEDCLAAMDRSTPDVVVLDQRMPGLSGLDVATKARDGGFDRPILLFSGHLEHTEWKRVSELGLLPVSKVDFAAVVRHVTAARRQYDARVRNQLRADSRPR